MGNYGGGLTPRERKKMDLKDWGLSGGGFPRPNARDREGGPTQ